MFPAAGMTYAALVMVLPPSEDALAALALALAGGDPATGVMHRQATTFRNRILAGKDPLGDTFCALRTAAARRPMGAVYTPAPIINAMLEWARHAGNPARVVDPGCGSGRFLVAAGRLFPNAELVGVEADPLAALLARAHTAVAGFSSRTTIIQGDYRGFQPAPCEGVTLFVGNPPYVRHHGVDAHWKRWFLQTAQRHGINASGLAGLHAHFLLATAELARPGDLGVFVTSAEWLDVNYGCTLRALLAGKLGCTALVVMEPSAMPFGDAATTAVISAFQPGLTQPLVGVRRVKSVRALDALKTTLSVPRAALASAERWSPLTRGSRRPPAHGMVELGELCKVHRGQVTGANNVWIAGSQSTPLPPQLLFPSVTRARELFAAGDVLRDVHGLRCVIDLPVDLDVLTPAEQRAVQHFLAVAKTLGADRTFVATHRRAWWSVGLRTPAPILATYMARRPPAFVLNSARVHHINIAHGIYPRAPLSDGQLAALARHLMSSVSVTQGRTYAGGLTKFEPGEMSRLLVPRPEELLRPLD